MRNVWSTCESIATAHLASLFPCPKDAAECRPTPWFCPEYLLNEIRDLLDCDRLRRLESDLNPEG